MGKVALILLPSLPDTVSPNVTGLQVKVSREVRSSEA